MPAPLFGYYNVELRGRAAGSPLKSGLFIDAMTAVWFIFVVGLLNTCLGFAVAVHLGRRYRALTAAEPGWDFDEEFAPPALPDAGGVSEPAAGTEPAVVPAPARSDGEPPGGQDPAVPLFPAIATASEGRPGEDPEPDRVEQPVLSDRPSEAEETASPPSEAIGPAAPSAPAGADASTPPPTSGGEEAIEAFLAEVEQYQGQLDRADAELRSQAESPDGDSIRTCLQSLLEAGREYAEQREQARARLHDCWGEQPEFGLVNEHLHGAVGRQDAQIESTERAIAAFPYTTDLSGGCRVMIDETARLMDANLLVRDTLDEAGAAAARSDQRLADLEPARRVDALTGADSRAALGRTLLEWMDDRAEHVDTLAVAVLDIDNFSQVNRRFGHAVGNLVLQAIGKLLVAEQRGGARFSRVSGERFVLLLPNVDLREATNGVERLRQIVELARFEYKSEEIRTTVSCGVAEATGDDTPDTILARAEATLMEAKRYGRNRTFLHEGKYPTPVVPPKFSLEPRHMTL